jgi:cytochrome c oxidase subunit 3
MARDRSTAYAEGARQGAPEATQVADRFHLLQNLAQVLDQVFTMHGQVLNAVKAGVTLPWSTSPAEGSHHLDILLGGVNTAVLIGSSLTMATAVHSAQVGERSGLVRFLLLTTLLGLVFLSIKSVEYAHKFEEHLVPARYFVGEGPHATQGQLFLGFYFGMTGVHALHMIIGIGILAVLAWQAWRGYFSPAYWMPVELTDLYWHFVDIVWIFLFPLLYLLGRH